VLVPPEPELLGQIVEPGGHVPFRDDALAEDALVEPAGHLPDPADVVLAVEHREVLRAPGRRRVS